MIKLLLVPLQQMTYLVYLAWAWAKQMGQLINFTFTTSLLRALPYITYAKSQVPPHVAPHTFCWTHPKCVGTNKFFYPPLQNLIKVIYKTFILPSDAIFFKYIGLFA